VISKISANVSNYFMDVHDVGAALNDVISMNTGYIFGAEYQWLNGELDQLLITPPSIRFGEPSTVDRVIEYEKDLTFYEGYLSKPYFMPIYTQGRGLFANAMHFLNLSREDTVSIQILFKKKKDYWRKNAHAMFGSYLMGNDYPASSLVARFMQDKLISILEKVSPIEVYNEYIEDVENKILNALGYQFHFRVAIKSPYHVDIKNQIEEVLQKYNSHNTFELHPTKAKHFQTHFSGCVITGSSDNQVLCYDEVMSLFSNRTGAVTEPSKQTAKVEVTDIIKLLPEHRREAVEVDVGITNDIAEAMKRVGLIKSARLYNDTVTAGVRLTVVQCDIPKGKILTHLVQKDKDIQAALGVPALGIEQGEGPDTVKFTIPNEKPAMIALRELLELPEYRKFCKENELAFIVGVDEVNNPLYLSLAKLVHLLVAGTTGSGKSVFINTLVISLVTAYSPDQLRLVMIDPKLVELQHFANFPHVDTVETDMDKAEALLVNLVNEMEKRYKQFKEAGVKNIQLYNEKTKNSMPFIVCVIDEYADLKDTHPKVEEHIARLGQKARAAGIHMVIATQRPSADIISGRVKAVIPNAISFNLKNNINYKTVFGRGIPWKTLLGNGDGVMMIEGYPKEFQRFQSAIVCPDESKEEEVFQSLIDYYSDCDTPSIFSEGEEEEDENTEGGDHPVDKLKRYIANTGETKTELLRKELGVKNTTLAAYMHKLVEIGWLKRHDQKSKGYELICPEEELAKYRDKE
jgi:S-DNA-T family DNA segregation ATPase FtsK/SpoIIIE